jgi:glycosyltransferase involved in cell wall biosynthesis
MRLISVIIPARNRIDYVLQAVNSVKAQRLPRGWQCEIIVVDNLSATPLLQQIKQDKNLTVIENKKETGPGGSRNIGLKIAKGELIAFLDSDDYWDFDLLEHTIDKYQSNPDSAFLFLTKLKFQPPYPFDLRVKWTLLNLVKTISLLFMYLINNRQLVPSGFYLCQISHMVFPTKLVRRLKFRENVPAAEDWRFVIDFLKHSNILIQVSNKVNFRYEIKSFTNKKSSKNLKWQEYKKLLKELNGDFVTMPWFWLFVQYIRGFSK